MWRHVLLEKSKYLLASEALSAVFTRHCQLSTVKIICNAVCCEESKKWDES